MDTLPSPEELNELEQTVVAEGRAVYGSSYTFELDGYKALRVYQAALDLLVECYRITGEFPKSEMYGLTQQLRRAAVSIVLNIAEGWGRNSKAELARFSDISRGSAHEVDAAFQIAVRLDFISSETPRVALHHVDRTSRMLYRLAQALRKK